jgi:hypothetical protein
LTAASNDVKPFQIESTLRQFTEKWDVEATDERGRGLVATLRAQAARNRGDLTLAPAPENLEILYAAGPITRATSSPHRYGKLH